MINIAKQIYAGWSSKTVTNYDLPEADIVPLGTSSNEKKKIEKFKKDFTEVKEYDNIPLPGFTLYKSNRRRYGSTDPSWLVIDPRGFLARISNENLENILEVTGITEGLIQQQCVWAREDSRTSMWLLPITSEVYEDAVSNTELIENKISIKDVQIGDKVILQNELTGRYMGTQSLYAPVSEWGEHKPHVFLRRQIVEVEPHKFHYQADVKILKVLEKTENPISREDSVDYMNMCIANYPDTLFSASSDLKRSYYSSRDSIRHVSVSAVPKLKMSFEEITKDEATVIYNEAQKLGDIGRLILESDIGERYLIDYPYSSRTTPSPEFQATKLQVIDITSTLEVLPIVQEGRNIYYGYGSREKPKIYRLDNFTKFYKIVKHVKNDSYV
jgi:hypothetical protein